MVNKTTSRLDVTAPPLSQNLAELFAKEKNTDSQSSAETLQETPPLTAKQTSGSFNTYIQCEHSGNAYASTLEKENKVTQFSRQLIQTICGKTRLAGEKRAAEMQQYEFPFDFKKYKNTLLFLFDIPILSLQRKLNYISHHVESRVVLIVFSLHFLFTGICSGYLGLC